MLADAAIDERLAELERVVRKLARPSATRDHDRSAGRGDSSHRRATSRPPRTCASCGRRCAASLRRSRRQAAVRRARPDRRERPAGRSSVRGPARWGSSCSTGFRSSSGCAPAGSCRPEREVIVSRGGVASWYGTHVPTRTWTSSRCSSADEFRGAVAEEKRKQRRPGAFDERVRGAVTHSVGFAEIDVLHPGLMFRAFAPYWSDEAGYALIDQFTRPRLLDRRRSRRAPALPAEYVAVRFYFSECFPATPENQRVRAHGRRVARRAHHGRPAESRVRRRRTRATGRRTRRGRVVSIGDGTDAGAQPRRAERRDRRRPRVRRHLRRLLVSGAALQRAGGGVLFSASRSSCTTCMPHSARSRRSALLR